MKKKNAEGLTLIEIVITISIIGIISAGCMLYIRQVIDLWDFTSFRNEVVSPVRIALTRMARDIRQVNDTLSVYFANSTKFQFNDTKGANIVYYLSNSNLMRNNDTLAGGVSSLNLTYYGLTNQPIVNPKVAPLATDILRIKVRINVFSGTLNKTFETQVFPRNLGG
jgi:prepilin-type N-terminal cleavage/methylation domain-containing protein